MYWRGNLIRLFAIALSALLVVACGGGGSGTPSTVQPLAVDPTVVSGTITGFGSVIIDGVEYAEGNVSVARDIDPRSEAAVTMAGVKVGQQVDASIDASGKLTKILVRATVVGKVESVDVPGSSFKAVGQTIKVVTSGDGKTIFEGVDGLAAIKVDDWVEVHGTIDADKNVLATRVEVQPPGGEVKVRAGGIVKEFSDSAKTFKLGDLTIDYKDAVIKPDGAKIENDILVFVYSDQLPSAGKLTAKAVRVAKMPTLEGRRFTIGGLVSDAAPDGKKFKVNGIQVDASSAELKGGQNPIFTDIKDMALVRVEGTLSGTGTGAQLTATRVWIIPASEQRRVMLIGQVTDFAPTLSFKVRGTPVDASAAMFKNGKKGDLNDGAFVLIKGRIDGSVVKADEVNFNAPPKDVSFKLLGTVSDYRPSEGTFRLLGIPMKLAAGTIFKNGTLADFGNGDLVEAKGSFDGAAFVVTEVEFKSGLAVAMIRAEGVISDVTSTSFKLNGGTFKVTTQTVIDGGPLANSQHVEVQAQLVGTDVVAVRVDVQTPVASARLIGPISDFTSKASFKVQGQSVDASAATLSGGTDTDLANGKLVLVEGALNAGVVKATIVKFLR